MAGVLVVDDTAFMRMMMRSVLEGAGMAVAGEAKNGLEAVKMYERIRPDLVTMDITMPEMDGIMALKQIKQFDPRAKIIMCSAVGQHDMVLEALRSGAVDFIVKPFQNDRVEKAVFNALR